MQISYEQFQLLELNHGKGMVTILSIGDDDFVFRKPSTMQVSHALECQAKGILGFREEITMGCVVSADLPSAGVAGQKKDAEDKEVLAGEKERLGSILESAQSFRDDLSIQFAWTCGSSPRLDCEALGNERYKLTLRPNSNAEDLDIAWGPVELIARKATRPEYNKYRQLNVEGTEGEAELFLWDKLIESANKADTARLYPFAVIAIGGFLPTLGSDGRSVRIKKFSAGPAPEPGSSTHMRAKLGTES
jgi:hypothetical protein